MKRVLITIDEDTHSLLRKRGKVSEQVRNALEIYQSDISTDTLTGMREAFRRLNKEFHESQQRSVELYDMLERVVKTLEDLASR